MIKLFISFGIVFLFAVGTVACDKTIAGTEVSSAKAEENSSVSTVVEGDATESLSSDVAADTSDETSTQTHTDTVTESKIETETETHEYEQTQTLNGVPIEDYEIICQSESYGVLRAAEYLSERILEISGKKIEVNLNSDIGDNVILIKDANDEKGEFFIEAAGSRIMIGGSGINGAYKAAKYLIDSIDGYADAEIDSVTAPLFTLEGSLDHIKEGRINIGFIGDSVTFGHGPVTPWPTYFIESMQKAYPDTEFRYENVSVSGKKSTWAAENIKNLLLKKKLGDIVFVAIGTNDKYQQGALSPVLGEQTKANYVSIIEQIKDANPNAQIVFVLCSRNYEVKGIVGVGGEVSPYIDAMLEVSDEYCIPIIDPMSALYDACEEHAPGNAMGNGWRYYMQDEVHPNAEGQRLYADVVFEHIKAALQQ